MIGRLAVAAALALTAGAAAILGLAAAADAWTHDGALTLIALTAVWLPWHVLLALHLTRRRRP